MNPRPLQFRRLACTPVRQAWPPPRLTVAMTLPSLTPKRLTLLLQKATRMRELEQIHAVAAKSGLLRHPYLLPKLLFLSALSPWGSLAHARSLLDSSSLLSPSLLLLLYNPLIRAYSRSIFPSESLLLFNQMLRQGVVPGILTFPFALKALGRAAAAAATDGNPSLLPFSWKGSELHCRILLLGFVQDGFIQNSLMFMYSQCGLLCDARRVFDEMVAKNTVSWNAMIAAYDRHGEFEVADRLFRQMPEKNVASWNSMITRHVRMGNVRAARRMFEEMPERDAVSWNSMIAGYVRVKKYERALELFKEMQAKEVPLTELTIVSVLGVCAETGALEIGREIHQYLRNKNFKIEGYVGNALLDMYAKCGSLRLAQEVFDGMTMKHTTCWNAMIVALAVHGHCKEALELFISMKESSLVVKPNHVTFLGVLIACSHKGLVKEGQEFFWSMVVEYKIEPNIKHYGCMIDLLSRCGLVEEAYRMIKEMPIKANSVLWKTVLAACRVTGNVELAEEAFSELAELVPLSDADCVLMSNIYAEAERWEDVERLRTGMIGSSISKLPGCSQIELH